MAYVVYDDGLTTVTIKHIEGKPNGLFQYRRRIPEDLLACFDGKRFFVRSLGRDIRSLAERAVRVSNEVEAEWATLRASRVGDSSAVDALPLYRVCRIGLLQGDDPLRKPTTLLLQQALELYLKHHPKGDRKKFQTDVERVVGNLIAQFGNLSLDLYTRQQAEEFRDGLLASRTTSTARRYLNTIVAVFNKVRREKQLQIPNPFEGLGIPREERDARRREPFSLDELRIVAEACRRLDDDIRHIIALQLDTGARLAEIVGLRLDDIAVNDEVPHLRIRPFGEVRTLKTPASQRVIPLVGEALWAADRVLQARKKDGRPSLWLFPRYASNQEILGAHASATLNKWLRSVSGVTGRKTTHCFRHSMRDRLRAAQVPHDIQEALGGWGQRTVGQGYGRGYPLRVLQDHMQGVVLAPAGTTSRIPLGASQKALHGDLRV